MKTVQRYRTLSEVTQNTSEMDGCRVWNGYIDKNGYGSIMLSDRRKIVAHRWVWILTFGHLSEDLVLHHECGVKACMNVDHLRPMTGAAHTALHNPRLETCARGHSEWRTRRDGRRYCVPCKNEYEHAWYVENRARDAKAIRDSCEKPTQWGI